MNKVTIGIVIAILAGFGGLVIVMSMQNEKATVNTDGTTTSVLQEATDANGNIADHVRGKADSKVRLVEYADLQCPGCAAAMKTVNEIYEEYKDRVAFTFRSFPLQYHQNARAASAACESAGMQGYFWEMLSAMYTARATWIDASGSKRTEEFVNIFKQVAPDGDVTAFKNALSDKNIEKKIDYDHSLGKDQDKISATPAFVINGKAIDVSSANTQDDLKAMITKKLDEELKKVGE